MNEPNNIRRELMRLMMKDPDHCSMCGTEFPDRSVTYGGVTKSGDVALVSECCVDQMKGILCCGLVVN